MCDLLWSDPDESLGWNNSPRGAGFLFGNDITQQFIHKNGIQQIVRAHQLFNEGFFETHNEKVVTIFSAPNYCYRCGNQAAIMQIDDFGNAEYIQFNQSSKRGSKNIIMHNFDYFL